VFENTVIEGGLFTFAAGYTLSPYGNVRLTESGATLNCGFKKSRFVVPSGVAPVAICGFDAGNCNTLLEDVVIEMLGTNTQGAFNFEPGSKHATLRRCRIAGPAPLFGCYNMLIEQCILPQRYLQINGGIYGGTVYWNRNIKVSKGMIGSITIEATTDDIEIDCIIGNPVIPVLDYSLQVCVGEASIDSNPPTNIRIDGTIYSGRNAGCLNIDQVKDLTLSSHIIEGLGCNSYIGTSAFANLIDVVIESTIENASLYVGKGCTFLNANLLASAIPANQFSLNLEHSSGVVLLDNCVFTAALAGSVVHQNTGTTTYKNCRIGALPGQGIRVDSPCTLNLQGNITTTVLVESVAIECVNSTGQVNIRDLGDNDWSNSGVSYFENSSGTMALSNGTIALNGATPVTYPFPLLRDDLVQVYRETAVGTPGAGSWTITNSKVVLTGTVGDSSTMRVSIGPQGAKAGRWLATS
jgi:hypothetical protein